MVFRSGSIRLTEILSGPETDASRDRPAVSFAPPPRTIHRSFVRAEPSNTKVALRSSKSILKSFGTCARKSGWTDRATACSTASDHPTASPRRPSATSLITARVNDLSIQSFHTFPDECAIVRTQSLFEVKPSVGSRT